ncbi:MFS transporter [Tenacibaculum sp. E3R01]|uniref:MFS transporter n=1 Tax=unclassified Tenacibaculum TaxID=2635139 RepID=UPI000898B75C|nr:MULTISPECIES: MFS transporter [unclassified Tenacibaculum]RBW62481.1 MFS transporter [Tenacibaculum sp. E3R01]SEE34632.1 Predicted arabinose efflux permease, MFS family [Tenacibaculum sp. MAR_2010_89]
MKQSKLILPIIVISQFCCTSLWFAGNAVMNDLIISFNLNNSALGHLTSAVQFGFIFGTLIFAVLTIADRFSPSKVFLTCALLGSIFNFGVIWNGNSLISILSLRFITGFFLAGIYPVGMKIAADYYENKLDKSLGFLVGALVVGTAFPHLAKEMTEGFEWKYVLILTSVFALLGGLLMVTLVPNGPFRKPITQLDFSAFFSVFRNHKFRSAAFGYFGHMWELYAFWAFVPIILKTYNVKHLETEFNIPLLSFLIIAIGGLACVLSGYLSQVFGTKRIAFIALLLSCTCCLISPIMFNTESESVFIGFLFFWGFFVIADSPLFSTLIAKNTSAEIKGTALTIVNCIGFSITIISIQLLNILYTKINPLYIYTTLAIGPIIGLIVLKEKTAPIRAIFMQKLKYKHSNEQ